MMNTTQILNQLIIENPNLDIISVVNPEICKNDDFYHLGNLETARIDWMYTSTLFGEREIYFKSGDEETLVTRLYDHLEREYYDWTEDQIEEEAMRILAELKWEKVIVLSIKPRNTW